MQKQEVLALLGHDLRSIFQSLKVSLELLGQGCYGDLSPQGCLRLTRDRANFARMTGLVDSIVDLLRLENGQLALDVCSVDLEELLARAYHSVRALASQKNITVKLPSVDSWIDVDQSMITRLVDYLLADAISHCQPGGLVDVSVHLADNSVTIAVHTGGTLQHVSLPDTVTSPVVSRSPVNSAHWQISCLLAESHQGSLTYESRQSRNGQLQETIRRLVLPLNTLD